MLIKAGYNCRDGAMDPVRNPHTPNAGARPPQLAGRGAILDAFETAVYRVEQGRTDKGVIVTGLRGVGKTVLLGSFEQIALAHGGVVIRHEARRGGGAFARSFSALARKTLLRISPAERWGDRSRRAAGALKGFKVKFDPSGLAALNYDVSALAGVADSGDLVADLPELGHAALEPGGGVRGRARRDGSVDWHRSDPSGGSERCRNWAHGARSYRSAAGRHDEDLRPPGLEGVGRGSAVLLGEPRGGRMGGNGPQHVDPCRGGLGVAVA